MVTQAIMSIPRSHPLYSVLNQRGGFSINKFPERKSPFSAGLFETASSPYQPIKKTPLVLLGLVSAAFLGGFAFLASNSKKEPETKKTTPAPTPVSAANLALQAKKQQKEYEKKIKELEKFIQNSGAAPDQAPALTDTKKYSKWKKDNDAREAEIQKKRLEIGKLNPNVKNQMFKYLVINHPEFLTPENFYLLPLLSKYASPEKKKETILLAIQKIEEAQTETTGRIGKKVTTVHPLNAKPELANSSRDMLEQFVLPMLIQEQKQQLKLNLTNIEKKKIFNLILNSEYLATDESRYDKDVALALQELLKYDTTTALITRLHTVLTTAKKSAHPLV